MSDDLKTLQDRSFLKSATHYERYPIAAFCREVNRRAEDNMLKTGRLEGAHHAAMTALLEEMKIEL